MRRPRLRSVTWHGDHGKNVNRTDPAPTGAVSRNRQEGRMERERETDPPRADAAPADAVLDEPVVAAPAAGDDEPAPAAAGRGGCLTERQGWAGAHLHGAVRPRRRAAGRGCPPGRWC
jgi:hypothetical protein